jgi:PAS domain S-box-containing protein
LSTGRYAAILFAVFFATCNPAKREQPKVRNGELDLRTWNFDKDGTIALDGDWIFYWQKAVVGKKTGDFEEPANRQLLRVPGSWNDLVRQQHPENLKPGQGFGTLRIKLLLPSRKDLLLFNAWAANSFILYCGDKPIGLAGRFAAESGLAAPFQGPTVASLQSCESTDLFWQIANFETYFGGPRNGWRIGKDTSLATEMLYRDFFTFGFVALTVFLGLCFFVTWLLIRKAWHYLVFGGLSFVAAMLRLSGEKVLQRFFSENIFDFQIRMEYGATAWCGVLVFWGLHLQYPRRVGRNLAFFISLPVLAATYLSLATPVASFTSTVPFLMAYLVSLLLLSMAYLIFLTLKKEADSGIFLGAVIALFTVVIHDFLVLRGILTGSRYSGIGFIALLGAQSWLTIRIFLRSAYDAKAMQGKLVADLATQLVVTERQNALLAAAADMWIINDPQDFGRIKDASQKACDNLGYRKDELLSLYIKDIEHEFPVSTEMEWKQHLEAIRAARGRLQLSGVWRRKNGSTFPVSVSVSLQNFQGQEYLVGIGRDMTQAAESDLALRRSEEKFQEFYRNNPLILFTLNNDGTIFEANPAAQEQLGYTIDEFRNRPMCDFVVSEDRAMARGYFEGYVKHPLNSSPIEYRQVSKPGKIIWVSQSLQVLRGNDGPDRILVSCRDITKRKMAEKALFESEAQMRLITEAIPGPVSHIGRDGTYIFVNKHYEEWFGDKKADIIGKRPDEVLRPELFATVESHFAQVRSGTEVTWETTIRPADGKERAVQIMHIPDFDLQGNVAGIFTIVYDISVRKHAENTLRSSLEEKEMLLAEIHHRVKNNLQVISSLISMQGRLISDSAAQTHLESLGLRIRAMGLLHNILYKSIGTGKVDMHLYLTSIAEQVMSVQRHIAEKIPLEIEIPDIHLNIETALPIGLIVNEAISNSIKYAFAANEAPRLQLSLKKEKSEYKLVIADNGPGMPAQIPKDTTLGLRLIETLVRQLRGSLITDTAGGVRFRITFVEQKKEENRWSRLSKHNG